MSNITNLNRDYLIKINVKEATIDVPKMTFWNTDKKTSNMFVQLVINMSTNELISQYVTVQNATDYKITLNVIKPKTKQYKTIEATLLNEEKALFEIDLPDEFTDQVGDYSFEFEVSSKVDSNDESITTSNGTYKVNGSILTNLNEETSSSPDLPILKQLIEQVKSLQGGDLTGYQKKSDNSLETTSKEVVGAINEVNSQFKDIVNKIDNIGTSQSTKQSILKGKKICVLGDSITDKTYHSTKNYHDFIKEKTGCTIYNHGKDSWTIVQLCDEVAKCENDSDIITLFAGTNDWHIGKIPLGEITDISKSVSVCGAIDEIFNLIINKFPTKTFLVFTPLPRTNPHSNWTNYTNDRGYSLEQLVDKIKEKCKQYSIPCYDLYRNSGVHANNSASLKYYYNDAAIHPNIRYHEILGINKMLPFILDNILFVEDTINKPCTNITLNNSALTFTDKTPQTLTATVTPTDTTDTITWSVNPTGICSVNNGVVTPIAKGTCNITATCGTKSATCGVEVESLSIDDSRRITMNNYNRGLFDLTTLVQNPKTQLSTVKLRIKGSHFENCEFMSASSVTVFSDNTGELNNSSYIGMSSPCSYNTDSLGYFECNWEVNNTYQTEYLKVPVVVKATNPNKECSFIIDDLQVLIDDVKVSILKLGGFFKDKETLTGDINYILNYVNQLS